MIYWTGRTTDKILKYTASGETYKEVYEDIQDTYGYDNIINRDALEFKKLEINGYDVHEFLMDYDGFDFEAYEKAESEFDNDMTEHDYRDIIEESTSQAYYHEFIVDEEV